MEMNEVAAVTRGDEPRRNESRKNEPRKNERGAGVVEWLGISALSIGMLVVIFAAMEALGLDIVAQIRGSLGL